MNALIFDTETTGLVSSRLLPLDQQPEVIEFYGAIVDLEDGSIEREAHKFIRPHRPIPQVVTGITGFVDSDFDDKPHFEDVAENVFGIIEDKSVDIVIAHNLSFDMEMMDIEAERLDRAITWPKRRECTVEATIYYNGYRLNLMHLHETLFGEGFEEAHRAKADTQALIRCCLELYERGDI